MAKLESKGLFVWGFHMGGVEWVINTHRFYQHICRLISLHVPPQLFDYSLPKINYTPATLLLPRSVPSFFRFPIPSLSSSLLPSLIRLRFFVPLLPSIFQFLFLFLLLPSYFYHFLYTRVQIYGLRFVRSLK